MLGVFFFFLSFSLNAQENRSKNTGIIISHIPGVKSHICPCINNYTKTPPSMPFICLYLSQCLILLKDSVLAWLTAAVVYVSWADIQQHM